MQAEERLKEKYLLIRDIYENKNTFGMSALVKLIEFMIANIREENDTADPELIRFNQGQLATLKELRRYVLNGK